MANGNSADKTPPSEDRTLEQKCQDLRVRQFHRHFLLTSLILAGLVFLWIILYFIVPMVVAGAFATLFYPVFEWIARRLGGRRGIGSLLTCLLLLLGILVPAYVIGDLVVSQAVELYATAQETVQDWTEEDGGLIGRIRNSQLMRWIHLQDIDWRSILEQGTQTVGTVAAAAVNAMSKGVIGFFTSFLIIFFILFYFFRDGDRIVERLKEISPMDETYEQAVIRRFAQISKATVKGTVLVGVTQGFLGALTLWVTGIDTWVLWGVVMAALSIIPMLGPYVVMIPAGIIQLIVGNYVRGLIILVMGTVIIGSVDNLMRPHVVGRGARMHDLIIFFATLGGIGVFGILGFIVGPVIAALFLTILDIFTVEFHGELDLPGKIQVK